MELVFRNGKAIVDNVMDTHSKECCDICEQAFRKGDEILVTQIETSDCNEPTFQVVHTNCPKVN